MKKTAPKEEEKIKVNKPTQTKETSLQKFYGERYPGFYEQLENLKKKKFNGDEESFMKHVEHVGDDIEFEFDFYDDLREIEKKEIIDLKYVEDVKGIKCSECGSRRTGQEGERQFRSLDEGSVSRFFCERCYGKKK